MPTIFARPSQGFWGTREHAHLFSGNNGTLANMLGEQGKLILGTGNMEILNFTFREQC